MEELITILKGISPDTDFETATDLIKDGILTSLDIVMLVSEIEDEFDVQITPIDIVPDNFCSAQAIYAMIKRLEDE